MATENRVDLSVSKGDLRKEYHKLNGIEAKLFNNNVLIAVKNSVIEDDTIQFRKYVEILEVVYKSDEKNGLKTSLDIDCPMYRTNVLLLACEHKAYKIFQLIISNYCNILNFSKIPVSPCDENAEGKNAYYYLMRLNKVDKLNDLIEKWPLEIGQEKLDQSLSSAYFKLLIQNVYLEDETKYFVEFMLNKIRLALNVFGKTDKPRYTFKDIKRRSYIIIDAIKTAIGLYSNNGTTEVDEKCLYILHFIAVNIGVLKRLLISTYDRLPWEEIEFCLVMFIKHFRCSDESSFYYRAHLNCEILLKYLDAFCIEFENVLNALKESDLLCKNDFLRSDVIKDIEMKNSVFKSLYETFIKLRDFHSIERLLFYLNTIRNTELEKNDTEIRIATIERCLQILIETLKNTSTSPNLSTNLNFLISSHFSDNLQKTFKEMQISLSQTYALRRRISTKNLNNFFNVKNDLVRIYHLTMDIFTRLKFNKVLELLDAIIIRQALKVREICEIFNFGLVDLQLPEEASNLTNKYSEIMQSLSKLKSEIPSSDQTLKLLFDELFAIVKENNDKLTMTHMGYSKITSAFTRTLGVIRDISLSKIEDNFYEKLHKATRDGDTFRKPETISSLEKIRVSDLLEQIIYHATNCLPKLNIREINRCKYRIINLLDIEGFTQVYKESNEITVKVPLQELKDSLYLQQLLHEKIGVLRSIFKNYGVDHSLESIKMFIEVYGKTPIFTAIEILLFDLLSICEKNLLSNVDLYDLEVPILLGKELREYLAHDRSLVHILPSNIKLSIIMNGIAFLNENNNFKGNGVINKGLNMNEIEEKYQGNLVLIDRKIKFFSLLKNKKLNILKKGMNVDVLSRNMKGFTVLHAAAKNVHLEVFKYFLSKIDDLNFLSDNRNILGQTLLHVSSYNNNIELLKYLLLNHLNLEHSINDFDNNNFIAVHYASAFGTAEMIYEFVLRSSSCIFIEDGRSRQAIHIAMHFNNVNTFKAIFGFREETCNLRLADHLALLHFAAEIGKIEFLDMILEKIVDINEANVDGWTVLHTACFFGNEKVAKRLLAKGADIQARTRTEDCTPIFYAVQNANEDTTMFLLENNAFVHDVSKKTGFSLLHVAAPKAKADIVEELIKHGVNLYAVSYDGQTALHLAAKENNIEAVKMLLQYNADVNCVDKFNCTPLHYAAEAEDASIFELLLKYFASISIIDSVQHRTPVQAALQNGQMEKIQCMVKMNIHFSVEENWKYAILSGNINVVDIVLKKCSQNYIHNHWKKLCELLSFAIQRKDNEIAKYLITNCLDIVQYDQKLKIKPLHVAIFTLNLEITQKLLEKYIEKGEVQECFEIVSNFLSILKYDAEQGRRFVEIVKLFIDHANMLEHGPKLLQHCIMNRDIASVRVLIESGVPISYKIIARAAMKSNSDIVKALVENSKVDGNTKELYSITLLHLVANNCNSSVVKYLITRGCDVNIKDDTNYTPIDYATMAGRAVNIEVLLQHGAKFNKTLHIAVENDFTGIAHLLLKYGADVNNVQSDGTPLQSAMRFGSQGSINLLLNNDNIDLNMHDGNKMSLLHIAAHFGDLNITKTLTEMGADVNAIDFEGAKPIHRALLESNLDILKYYLDHNYIDVNEATSDNFSLLHYAASRNNVEATRLLLEKGANVNSKDIKGETPLHIAAMYSSKEMCEILLNAGASYNSCNKNGHWPFHVSKDGLQKYFSLINTLFRYVYSNDKVNLIGFLENHRNNLSFNYVNDEGKGILHVAIASGHSDIVSILLQFDVNLNLTDAELNTPLHYAAKLNNLQLVEQLLANGAIYSRKNIENFSPSDVTSDPEIKRSLANVDNWFLHAKKDSSKFLTLLKNISNHEEIKTILFGARNCANQSLYTFLSETKGQDFTKLIDSYLSRDVAHLLKEADVLTNSGDHAEALRLLEQIGIKYENLYGWNNPLTLNVQSALAKVLYRLGEHEQCLSINQKILEAQLKNHDKNTEIMLKLRCFSGLVLYGMGKYEAALIILQAVCNSQVNMFGHMHDEVLNTKRHIGWVLLEMGKYEESLKLYHELYQAYKERHGKNYPTTLIIATNIGMVLYRLTKYEDSLKFYQFVYKKYIEIHGMEHLNSLRTLRSIANILAQTNRFDEALQMLNTVYEIQRAVLGDTNDDTLQTQQDMSVILEKHGAMANVKK